MKSTHVDPHREYRDSVCPGAGEVRFQVVVEQTDLLVVAQRDLSREITSAVSELRGMIKNHILFHPEFGESLTPVDVVPAAAGIVHDMADAAMVCGVGPMAAVAGAMAQRVADAFVAQTSNLLVENGGDVFMYSTRERVVALLADPESGTRIGLRLPASSFPLAVCSSSATIGHSLSLGEGDLVSVVAGSGAFADAAATALCNQLRGREGLRTVLENAKRLSEHGLRGVFAQQGDQVAAWGEVELTALD